jgi:hypothetical protein
VKGDPELRVVDGGPSSLPDNEFENTFDAAGGAAAGFVAGAFASPLLFLAAGMFAGDGGAGLGSTAGAVASIMLASTCGGIAAAWSSRSTGVDAWTVGTIAFVASALGSATGAGVGVVAGNALPGSVDDNRLLLGGSGGVAVGVVAGALAAGLVDQVLME